MATIRSALSLYDGMTGPLQSIHKALNIVLNSFEAVQTASGNAIDSSAIQDAREELARAGTQLDQIEQNIRDADREQDRFNDHIREGENAAEGLANKFGKLKGAIAALGIGAGIKKLVELSDSMTSTTARLSLIADDGGTVNDLEQQLKTLATTDPTVNVTATDNGTIETLEQQIRNLPDSVRMDYFANDNGTVADIERKVHDIENNRDITLNVTDNGAIAAYDQRIKNLDQKATVAVNVTGEEQLSKVYERAKALEQNASGSVTVNNQNLAAVDRQISDLNQEAAVNLNVSGTEQLAQIQEQASGLEQTALVTVNATDNGAIAALDQQIDDLSREASVTMDVTANVTDNDSVKILEAKIFASAQRSRAAYLDTANAIASMGANARSAFATNDELIMFMEQINKQFVIGGASAQGQAAAMLQLTQAMGAGALRGEELNSILENAPGIARVIEQYMGVAEGSIKKYAEEGLITADVVKNAMFAAADETNAKFESMPMTWAQIWTSMQNRGIRALEPILDKINAIANSDRMQGFVDGMMNAFGVAVGVLGAILDLVSSVGSAVYDNWALIEPIILGVAAALLIYNGYLLVTNTLETISNGLKALAAARSALKSGATIAEAAATTTATGAQVGLNAALLACPVTWIVIGIIAIVAALYAAVAAVNKFAGTSVSATGIICGAFMTALAFIGNIFVALWNIVVDVFTLIYNLVATVANFIGNVFNDPVGAVCRLFFDLADTVLGVLQSLAGAIDAIFGSNLSGAVQGWRDSLGGWVDSTFGKGEEIMEKMNADDLKLDRFEYGAAFDLGYKFGEGVEDTIGDLFKMPELEMDSLDAFNLGNSLDGIYGNTGDTAANTAASADKLDYMDEDLAWMRDIAEREAINRYTTAEITVEQHNENHISKDADLDGIMDAWSNDFAERLAVSGEGVHE